MKNKEYFRPDYWVDVWEERDRLMIVLYNDSNEELASWADEEAQEMFEDGFFDRDRLTESIVEYYEEHLEKRKPS